MVEAKRSAEADVRLQHALTAAQVGIEIAMLRIYRSSAV